MADNNDKKSDGPNQDSEKKRVDKARKYLNARPHSGKDPKKVAALQKRIRDTQTVEDYLYAMLRDGPQYESCFDILCEPATHQADSTVKKPKPLAPKTQTNASPNRASTASLNCNRHPVQAPPA